MPTQAVPTITALPTPPTPGVPSTFASLAFAFTAAQRDTFQPQMQALGANVKVNADDALLSASSANTRATAAAQSVIDAADQVALATIQKNATVISAAAAAVSSNTAAQAAVLPGWVTGTT